MKAVHSAQCEKVLAVVRAVEGGLLDAELAVKTGIVDRAALRPLLAELVADGQIAVSDDLTAWSLREEDYWVDGTAPMVVRPAPGYWSHCAPTPPPLDHFIDDCGALQHALRKLRG